MLSILLRFSIFFNNIDNMLKDIIRFLRLERLISKIIIQ